MQIMAQELFLAWFSSEEQAMRCKKAFEVLNIKVAIKRDKGLHGYDVVQIVEE